MTEFVLRIFFSGLIAILPDANGTEVTVLAVNTPHEYSLADGATLPHHTPFIITRAANCLGDCGTEDRPSIATFLYRNQPPQQAAAALNGALQGGGAWHLSGSDLTLIGPTGPLSIRNDVRGQTETGTLQLVPTTPAEREDITWVASLPELAPGTEGFKAAVTGSAAPPEELVAARLKLSGGNMYTYALAKIDGKARPTHFRKPSGEGPAASYAQALATWVAVDIRVAGSFVELVEKSFADGTQRRSMKLYPQEGLVEMAILNLPPYETPAPNAEAPLPLPGQHFQVYYDLVKTVPEPSERLVPFTTTPTASEPQVDWATLHPRQAMWSDLLEQINLSPRGKAPYDLSLCPIVRNDQP